MTEIEEKFMEIFDIHKKCTDKKYDKCTGICYDCKHFEYPQITSDILFELIQLLMTNEGIKIYPFVVAHNGKDEIKGYNIICKDYFYNEYDEDEELEEISVYAETLKNSILKAITQIEENYKGYLLHQVQSLFMEVKE